MLLLGAPVPTELPVHVAAPLGGHGSALEGPFLALACWSRSGGFIGITFPWQQLLNLRFSEFSGMAALGTGICSFCGKTEKG